MINDSAGTRANRAAYGVIADAYARTWDAPPPWILAELDRLAGLVPNGRVHVVEGAGHYPQTEFPKETADAVLSFVREAVHA